MSRIKRKQRRIATLAIAAAMATTCIVPQMVYADETEDAETTNATLIEESEQGSTAYQERLANQILARNVIDKYVNPEKILSTEYKDGYTGAIYTGSQKAELMALAEEATRGCTTDYEKIYAVYLFVARNIYYNVEYQTNWTSTQVYDVWQNKIAVCDGYAELCNCLLQYSGVASIKLGGGGHAWNTAYDADSKQWIYFDATWGSGNKYYASKNQWRYVGPSKISPWYYKYEIYGEGIYEGNEWKAGNHVSKNYFNMTTEAAASLWGHRIYGAAGDYCSGRDDKNMYYSFGISGENVWFAAIEYTGNDETLTVPEYVDDIPVVSLSHKLFYSNTTLKEVTIPSGIKRLGTMIVNSSVKKVVIEGDPPVMAGDQSSLAQTAFDQMKSTAKIYYPCDNKNWTPEVVKKYCGDAKWIPSHEKGAAFNTVAATCGSKGKVEYRCIHCGETITEEIAATGEHEWGKPEKTRYGTLVYTCKICGITKSEVPELMENPIKISSKKKTVTYRTLKKKAVTVSPIKVKKAVGTVRYRAVSGNKKKLTINEKTGKIKVKRKTKPGTYTLTVKVRASGNSVYDSDYDYVTVKVIVKNSKKKKK